MLYLGGTNHYFQLGEESNNPNIHRAESISPPLQSRINLNSLLSYSIYCNNAVLVRCDGILQAVGYSLDSRVSGSLPQKMLTKYTKFFINDSQGHFYIPISAVCGTSYTLYLVSNDANDSRLKLALSTQNTKTKYATFLNIGDSNPVSIFGYYSNAAAIDSEGRILYIPISEFQGSSESLIINPVSLPNGDKAISVAQIGHLIALGSSGRVYKALKNSQLQFQEIEELQGIEIINISGTIGHGFAVSRDGRVYGLGSNYEGQLGIGQTIKSVEHFTEIVSLNQYRIVSAYAGFYHSLFQTLEGKILACGSNDYGQLLLSTGVSYDYIYLPVETSITSGASFCIAGYNISAVFCGFLPPNNPNVTLMDGKKIERPMSFYEARREISALKEEVAQLKNEIALLQQRNDNNNI